VLGTSLLWRSTVAFTYLKLKSAKCFCLLLVVLVLSFWSWSCSSKKQSWSWSCYFGLCLGLKNLVLFTSLISITKTTTTFMLFQTAHSDDPWQPATLSPSRPRTRLQTSWFGSDMERLTTTSPLNTTQTAKSEWTREGTGDSGLTRGMTTLHKVARSC